ncbi:MAG: copper transporter [Armatimonadetes bacterium]|nr:copper transporter [Armatimonadota bacterium]
MIDFKYHVASLVAVFLAVAVGILIGTSMLDTPSVENQIKTLKAQFDRIQAESRSLNVANEELRGQARVLESALRQVAPAAVQGRLAGKRVAFIISGRPPEAAVLREVKFLLATAGAGVSSITTFAGNLLPENPISRQALVDEAGLDMSDPDRARRRLAARVTREIVLGRSAETLRVVAQYSPGVTLDGSYDLPVDAVVLFAAAETEEEARSVGEGTSIQARIADVLREEGIHTVACELETCQVPLIPYLARYNLTTVDGIDTPLGKIALIYALAGKQGHYGTRPPAAQVLPELDITPITSPGAPPDH